MSDAAKDKLAVGRPMRAEDFKKCARCGKGMAHAGTPIFYRVTLESMMIDARAVQRTDAMEKYMGGAVALARVFEDPVIAQVVVTHTTLLCQPCAMQPTVVAALGEE